MKRTFDVIGSFAGLVVLAPLFMILALVVKGYDGGPVFFASRRVGKEGRLFRLYKFRTMVVGADRMGPGITTAADRRITRAGVWLRRLKLDELPQLWNVLRGDMSLVGPRPEDPRYVALYTPEQRQVLAVRPGLTSMASLAYRREEALLTGPDWETVYCEDVLPAKLALELRYLQQRTLWTDVGILLRTVWLIFNRSGQ